MINGHRVSTIHFKEENTQPRKKTNLLLSINSGSLIGNLVMVYDNPPHNWAVFHPLYSFPKQTVAFIQATTESTTQALVDRAFGLGKLVGIFGRKAGNSG